MRILVQRVKCARTIVDNKTASEIGKGLLLFVGIGKDDAIEDSERLAKKIASLRIFEDQNGKMNLSIKETGGEILSVPQFTLCANTSRGNRPGFEASAEPQGAKVYWKNFDNLLRSQQIDVKEGVFGAHMEIALTNDGPVTIWLDSRDGVS